MENKQHDICLTPIGIIHSPFKTNKGTPIQPAASKGTLGEVEVFEKYADGLKDLEGFSHIMLLFHLHLVEKTSLQVIPFMDQVERGVFSTRAPSRPNHLGISVVELIRIEGNVLHIRNHDIVDQSPLIDIKPYIDVFDSNQNTKNGWLDQQLTQLKQSKDDGRFTR